MPPRSDRRTFLKKSVAAACGASAFTIAGTRSSGKVLGANDTIRIAVAGLNGRGGAHIQELLKLDNVQITYLVDPDTRTFAKSTKDGGAPYARSIKLRSGASPQLVQDIQQVLDDPNVDAISIATPNHWHSLMTIWACQAGKDVYVEKPCSHNIHEGRIAVDTARKYNRIVQHGTQHRSNPRWIAAIDFLRSGQAGKVQIARGLCYKPRPSIGFKPTSTPPSELDFDLWLGPAPEQPYHGNLVHYNWHWFWDTGNGDIGNQGVHHLDIARWGLPNATLPRSVYSLGGRFGYEDQGQSPNSQIAVLDYGDAQMIFEVRGLKTLPYHHQTVNAMFHCENGIVTEGTFYPKDSDKPQPITTAKRADGKSHFANFIEAVRTRDQGALNADILEGHYSSALGHLANISYRLGEEVPFSSQSKALGDDKAAYETFERMEEYLSGKNNLVLDNLKYRLGRTLQIDAEKETIVGDPEAAAMLTRNYREGYVVPDKVV